MKRFPSFTTFLLLLIAGVVNAQSVVAPMQSVFLQQYANLPLKKIVYTNGNILASDGNSFYLNDENGNNIGSANAGLSNSYLLQQIVATSNGYVYCLYQYTAGTNAGMVVMSLDNNLNFRWMQEFYSPGSTFGYGMAPTPDNGIMICGTTCSTGYYLLKINSNGTQQFEQNVNIPGYCIPYAITSYMGNEFAIATRTQSTNDNEVIFITDSAGNVLGAKSIPFSDVIYVKAIKADANGNLYSLVNESNGTSDIVSLSANLTTNTIYHVSHDSESIQLNDLAYSNSSVLVAGNINISGTTDLDVLAISVNTNSNSFISKTIGGTTGYNDAYEIVTDNQQRFYMSGTATTNGYVAKLNSDLTGFCNPTSINLTVNQFSGSLSDVSYSVTPGTLLSSVAQQVVESTAANAISGFCNYQNIVPGTNSIADVSNPSDDVSLYPNPANNELNIMTTFTTNSKVTYIMSDELGRRIAVGVILNGANMIDITSLSSGEYYISLVADNQIVTKRFIKAE